MGKLSNYSLRYNMLFSDSIVLIEKNRYMSTVGLMSRDKLLKEMDKGLVEVNKYKHRS